MSPPRGPFRAPKKGPIKIEYVKLTHGIDLIHQEGPQERLKLRLPGKKNLDAGSENGVRWFTAAAPHDGSFVAHEFGVFDK